MGRLPHLLVVTGQVAALKAPLLFDPGEALPVDLGSRPGVSC